MKRIFSLLLVVVLLFCGALPVFAADDVTEESPPWYSWFTNLFIPSDDFFNRKNHEINQLANQKLGGVADLWNMVNDIFNEMQNPKDLPLELTVPNNFFTAGGQGFSVDFFQSIAPALPPVRAIITSVIILLIAIACYHKLRTFFSEGKTE